MTAPDPLANLTAGDIEMGVHRALEARDMEAVVGLMRMLAAKDPGRASLLLDIVNVGIALNRADRERAS